MFSIGNRRWFYPTVLALAILVEVLILRASWHVDTQKSERLRNLQVRSGYQLLVESSAGGKRGTILSYNASSLHNHRLMIDIGSARLSEETLSLLAVLKPPKTAGRLVYAPEPSEKKIVGRSCLIAFRVELPDSNIAESHFVQIAPPKPDEVLDKASMRRVHLASKSPLVIRVSANSHDGLNGPGCRNLLSIGNWQMVTGKDLELAFVSDPGARVDLTLTSPSFQAGVGEMESLEIEPLRLKRLYTRPLGLTGNIQSRESAGKPPLTLTKLQLGGDFFDVELAGMAGVPISEILGWTRWPIVLSLDLPLLALWLRSLWRKKTVFLSYSWSDKDRVLPIYERLKQTNLDLWIDRTQLRGGDDWEREIREKMLRCRRVVIFLSHSLKEGGFFLAELGLARAISDNRFKRTSFIIPVRLEECPIPSILSPWNAIDLFGAEGERRLFEALGVAVPGIEKRAAVAASGERH